MIIKHNNSISRLFFFLILGVSLSANDAISSEATGIYGNFSNPLPPVDVQGNPQSYQKATSATFFSGYMQAMPDSDGNPVLFSMGQAFSAQIPYENFQLEIVKHAKKRLYVDFADNNFEAYKKDQAAFRYKSFIYGIDEDDESATFGELTSRFENISDHWGDDEIQRALAAAEAVKSALRYDPSHTGLRNVLLDINYDIAIANILVAKEKQIEATKSAMGLPGYIPLPGKFSISNEIMYLEQSLEAYNLSTVGYYKLLTDPMGIDISLVSDPSSLGEVPFGYHMFYQMQATRSLYAASFEDQDGLVKPILDEDQDGKPDAVFSGYKDLVLLYEIERDKARLVARLAKLLAIRDELKTNDTLSDRQQARQLIAENVQNSYINRQILNGMFDEAELALVDDSSGILVARAGLNQGLDSINRVKSFIDDGMNPLGLPDDFLALVQNDSGDSFDYFISRLNPQGYGNEKNCGGLAGQLADACTKYQTASNSYEKFRSAKDTIVNELSGQRRQFADRLRSLVGCSHPSIDASPEGCDYETPQSNVGGEVYQQVNNIELARLRINKNAEQSSNLQKQIEHEIDRRGKEAGINNLIGSTYISFGEKQAKLTQEIGIINAVQAIANSVASSAALVGGPKLDFGITASTGAVINGVIQAAAEITKSNYQARKEQLAADQSADIAFLTDKISAAGSEARIKDLYLGMSILAIESMEAAILIRQELGRMQALLDEKNYLEAQWLEAESKLGTRYFADPSHRIVMSKDIIDAQQAFDKAQLWVFILARSLEYKWNRHIVAGDYTAKTVFKLRNADELVQMATALYDYNETFKLGSRGGNDFEKLSLREDILGYKRIDVNGNTVLYPDPADPSGESMVDAITAFQNYVNYVAPRLNNPEMRDAKEAIQMRFSTAGVITRGFSSKDHWNEKINSIAVNINAVSTESTAPVRLIIGGVAYVRTKNPDVEGELNSYTWRHWKTDVDSQTGTPTFTSEQTFGATFKGVIVKDPDRPQEAWKRNQFHEMPALVGEWVLEIATVDDFGDLYSYELREQQDGTMKKHYKINDIEIWFYNYYLDR